VFSAVVRIQGVEADVLKLKLQSERKIIALATVVCECIGCCADRRAAIRRREDEAV
jgi:hypothetical protein